MAAYTLQGLTLGLVLVIPGPFQTYIISQTLKEGWRRTLPASFAPLVSDGPIIVLMVLLLTQTPAWFLDILQVAGGLYILWLAVSAFQSARALNPMEVPTDADAPQTLVKAAIINALNPNPYIFWGTVGARTLVQGWRETPAAGIGFLVGFYVTAILSTIGIILLFGTARQLGPRVTRTLAILSSILLFGFGVYQLISGVMAVSQGLAVVGRAGVIAYNLTT